MTPIESLSCRITAMSCEMNRYESASSERSRASRFTMPARTDTSRADVGSSRMRICGSAASARAIATRWAWPPDISCGSRSVNREPSDTMSSSSVTRAAACLRPGTRRCTSSTSVRARPAVSRGFSEEKGSCETSCSRRASSGRG